MLLRKDALMKVDEAGKNMCALALCIYVYTHALLRPSASQPPTPRKKLWRRGERRRKKSEGMLHWIRGMHGRARVSRSHTHTHTCPSPAHSCRVGGERGISSVGIQQTPFVLMKRPHRQWCARASERPMNYVPAIEREIEIVCALAGRTRVRSVV